MIAGSMDDSTTRIVIDASASSMLLSQGTKTLAAAVFPKSNEARNIIRSALLKSFIFQTLAPAELERLIDVFSPVSCDAGDHIIDQGGLGDFM